MVTMGLEISEWLENWRPLCGLSALKYVRVCSYHSSCGPDMLQFAQRCAATEAERKADSRSMRP
jgi:hypothetical protein